MENYRMRIFLKVPSDRNPHNVGIIYDPDDLVPTRILQHRGFYSLCSLSRKMNDAEVEFANKCWRYHWHLYKTWEGLVVDEYLVTHDLAWCQQILDLSGLTTPLQELLKEIFEEEKNGVLPKKKKLTR
jgi:hypothetical protein